MEGVLAIIFLFGGGALVGISYSPVGRAIAERLRGKRLDDEPSEELLELRDQVASLQPQAYEQAERLDFAERLLAQARERGALAAPKGSA